MHEPIPSTDSAPKTLVITSDASLKHVTSPGHPECMERYGSVVTRLRESGLMHDVRKMDAPRAAREQLLYAHSGSYVDLVERECESGGPVLSTGDTEVGKGSWEAAVHGAGAALAAVDQIFEGAVKRAFCVARPPGHHASPARGMGFCLFNNAGLAARRAQRVHDVSRVAILDWDVHHGNGTQDVFYEDGSVYFFSVHQWPLYPGTGAASETGRGEGRGTTCNAPLPAGSGRDQIFSAVEEGFVRAMEKFQPELYIISAGFDSRKEDPLGGFQLTDRDFADLTRMVLDLAEEHAGGRVVSVMEGGYNLRGLANAVEAHVGAMVEAD